MEYGRSTVVVEKRCCIFDVGIKFDNRRSGFTRSSNQRSYWIVVWDWRHSVTHRLRIKSHRLHIRPRIVLVLPHSSTFGRESSTCCHAFLRTAAHRLRAAAHRLYVATHLDIRPRIERTSLVDIALLLRGVKYRISYSRSASIGSYKIGFKTELVT